MSVRMPVVFVSEEHFLPFLVSLGAPAGDAAQAYRPHFNYAGWVLDAYVGGERADR